MNPQEAGVYFELGKSCRGQGRWPEAEAALKKALEFEPENGWVRIEMGTLYLDQDKLPEAAAEFERVITTDRSNSGAHCQLGRIYYRQGQWPKAEASLRKALELDPQNGGACIELGTLYEEQSRFPEAAAELEGAVAIDRDNGGARFQLGRIFRRQGRTSEAERALKKALELDPKNSLARNELGILFLDQDRLSEAGAELERAIAIDPNNGGAHCQLGRTYRRQRRSSEAEVAFKKALELDPKNGWAHSELGALYQGQERLPEAAAEFERARTIDPHDVGAHIGLGHIYLRQGQWAEAEAEFLMAAALDPRDDGAHIGLWAAYRGRGRLSEAAAALTKAMDLNPSSALACTGLLERLERDHAIGVRGGSGPTGMGALLAPGVSSDAVAEQLRERVFCLLPWTHLHVRTDGLFRPCCMWSDPPLENTHSPSLDYSWNSPVMKSLRLDLMNGRPVEGCWKCYERERAGFWSMRQIKNIDLVRHRGRERLTAPDGTLPRLQLPFLDLRFSNACNLRCRTCDASQSSAWMADTRALGLPVVGERILKSNEDWNALWHQLQPLLEQGVEDIRFAGGEPLIMEEHYRVLDFLIERKLTDVRLTYNTNFSTLRFQGRDVIDLWSRFREVRVAASLDGSGRRGEYLRKGLCWDAVVANREEMLRRCPDVVFELSVTPSIFNALHLPDFHREWVEKGYVRPNAIAFCMLATPEIYRMQVLRMSRV